MFKQMLVPLDGSSEAEAALVPAIALAMRCEGELVLVNVISNPWISGMGKYLTDLVRRLIAEGVRARIALPIANPAEGIHQEAEREHADLIIMSPHDYSGLEAWFHSSVTWQVFRKSQTPVLAWKGRQAPGTMKETPTLPRFMRDPTAPLLVPLDGSSLAEAALPLATVFAQLFGNPMLLVRAAEEPFLPGVEADTPEGLTHAEAQALAEAQKYLQHQQLELAQQGQRVEVEAAVAIPTTYIEAMVRQHPVGLVVMASHGRSGPGRWLLGSTARSLLRQLEVPLVLVPAEVDEAETRSGEANPTREALGTKRS